MQSIIKPQLYAIKSLQDEFGDFKNTLDNIKARVEERYQRYLEAEPGDEFNGSLRTFLIHTGHTIRMLVALDPSNVRTNIEYVTSNTDAKLTSLMVSLYEFEYL